jgi:hypothetical protein
MRRLKGRTLFAIGAAPVVGLAMGLPAATMASAAPATRAHASAVQAESFRLPRAVGPTSNVIIFLRNDASGLAAQSAARLSILRAEETPVVSSLRAAGARDVTAGAALPFVIASVTAAQRSALAADPLVSSVFADSVIPAPLPESAASDVAPSAAGPAAGTTAAQPPTICGTAEHPELDPEAISVINAPQAAALGYDGAGVTVAYIAGGIESNNPDFVRNPAYASAGSPVGSSILTPVNLTGDAAGTPSGEVAGESFLDASSIAAQGNQVYDISQFVNQDHPTPQSPCDIKIVGASPGANIMGIDVFSTLHDTTESNFIQAIDYAVKSGVKVINESFGSNQLPDTALDVTRVADDLATDAGVTVVVSSGDAGVTSTIGSPSTDPNLISVGATTTFRAYEQTTDGGINATNPNASNGTWLDNNISGISSGGFAQDGKTVDLVAPGDLNWALCDADTTLYSGCTNYQTPAVGSPIQLTGGTSESAPLTAGAAADVIQAYAETHGGVDPSPALVKQILTSTATDIDAPGDQQGAGLLNVLAAVNEATSIKGTTGTPRGGLLIGPNQIDIAQKPGASATKTVSVTNTGSSTANVSIATRQLTKVISNPSSSFCLNPSSATIAGCGPPTANTFEIVTGVTEVYQEETFSVPAMTSPSRLDFSADYPDTGQSSVLHVALLDPSGTYAAYSIPQGLADYADVQVSNPAAGTWTAIFYTEQDASGVKGTVGTIQWQATNSEFVPAGTVSPTSLTLAAGQTGTFTFTAKSPSAAGDTDQSIVLTSGSRVNTIPVTMRTLVPIGLNGGTFDGVITGGNGRGNPAVMNSFQFSVPPGERDVDISAAFSDAKDTLAAFLVDPNGQTLASSSNDSLSATGQLVQGTKINLYKDNPQPGLWELVLAWLSPVSGSELTMPFTGAVRFNQVSVSSNLPKSPYAELTSGKSYTFDVTVKNTGLAPEQFFLDARTTGHETLRLPDLTGSDQDMTLPLSDTVEPPIYDVPTDTTSLLTTITGTVPVTYDVSYFTGDPDLSPDVPMPNVKETQSGDSASMAFTVPEVGNGLWDLNPSEFGPYAPAGAPTATASATFSVVTQAFNPTVTTSTSDLWTPTSFNGAGAPSNFKPVSIAPGATAKIPLTIKPTAAAGARVSGLINVDDVYQANSLVGLPDLSADEFASLPFSYKVASPLQGYWIAGRDGGVFHFGYGHYYGSAKGRTNSPIIGMAATPDHGGYFLVSAAGGVYAYGDAVSHGSLVPTSSVPVVGTASDATGLGYWLVNADGHVSKFGDAVVWGSEDYSALHETVVGIASTPDGLGYWLVAADGNVLPFGDARFHGSPLASRLHLAKRLVGIAATLDGNGYWLVGADGGIFAYGDAKFYGSMYGHHLNGAAVGMSVPQSGNGYWVFAEDGGVFTFGGAKFFGSLGASSVSGRSAGSLANS